MRIGVNARFLLKDKMEGIGVFTDEICKRLVKLMPEHTFYFYFDRDFDPSFIYSENIIGKKVFPPTRHPILWKWWFDYALPQQMEKDKIDIFLSTDGYCSLNTNIPQILTIHDIAFEHFPEYIPFLHAKFMRYYTPKYIEKAAKIITVSEFSKQDIIQQYKLDSNKIEVVYNAFFEAQNDSQEYKFKINVPYFIFIGAIHPRKNVLNLIEAFEKFKQKTSSEFKMVLVGRDAWHNEEFKTNLRKSSVQKDIIWIEKINRSSLIEYLKNAYALTYLSEFEGFGIPLVEAMEFGIPIIASNKSAIPEIAGNAAVYCEPNNIHQIAETMNNLVENKVLYKQLKQAGLERKNLFSWDKSAEKIAQILLKYS